MDESYKSGVFRVTFEIDVVVKDGHHGEAIINAYQALQERMESGTKASPHQHFDVKSDNKRGDAAWFDHDEVRQIVQDWSPQPGDRVRMWLDDSSVRGTLFSRPDGRMMVGLVEPGVDPSALDINTFTSYLVQVDGRQRRMELAQD